MTKTLVAAAVTATLALTGCSSTKLLGRNDGVQAPISDSTAIKDRTITTEWRDDGIKISYDLVGNVDRIEITYKVKAFNADYRTLAELQARARLTDFIYGTKVSSERRVKVIARTLEHDADNTLTKFKDQDGTVNAGAVEQADAAAVTNADPDSNSRSNTSSRRATAIHNKVVNTMITSTSSGKLVGWQVFGSPESDGKLWVTRLVWERKTQAAVDQLRTFNSR